MRLSQGARSCCSPSGCVNWRTRWRMPDRSRQNAAEFRIATFARHVLVPIAFSKTSRAALAWAVAFVNRCDASLHLLHVPEEIVGAEPLEWHLGARSEIERAVE